MASDRGGCVSTQVEYNKPVLVLRPQNKESPELYQCYISGISEIKRLGLPVFQVFGIFELKLTVSVSNGCSLLTSS